jgi:hypothetical protein
MKTTRRLNLRLTHAAATPPRRQLGRQRELDRALLERRRSHGKSVSSGEGTRTRDVSSATARGHGSRAAARRLRSARSQALRDSRVRFAVVDLIRGSEFDSWWRTGRPLVSPALPSAVAWPSARAALAAALLCTPSNAYLQRGHGATRSVGAGHCMMMQWERWQCLSAVVQWEGEH